jgi:hypothetical protein
VNPALGALDKRVEGDPFFLAALLKVYANGEALDDAGLAAAPGCGPEALAGLRLCRAPRAGAKEFRADVARVAGHLGLDEARLLSVLRRAEALRALAAAQAGTRGVLLAARDGQPPGPEGAPPGERRERAVVGQ